jgi:AraC-like DNA-binding protein
MNRPLSLWSAMVGRFRSPPNRLVLPDVRCDLLWADERVLFLGPSTHARASLAIGKTVTVASFDALAVRQWLNIPIQQLTDRVLPLADLAPSLEDPLAEQFAAQADHILLPRRHRPVGPPDLRIHLALSHLRLGRSVRHSAAAVCLSERQMERLFQDGLGLSPRSYIQIRRLRRAMCLARQGVSLVRAAVSSGFADQAHFTRKAKELLGETPSGALQNVGNLQDVLSGTIAD